MSNRTINHTLYQGLGATRRARLHHYVAIGLESLYGGDADDQLADLALHWRLATLSADTTKAAGYSLRAGRRALDSLAPSEAATLFSDALELLGPEDSVDRCEALIGLGEAQRLTGDPAFRATLLDAARLASKLDDGERAARAALTNSRGGIPSASGQVDQERVAAIERALELDEDPERRALLLSLQAIELVYEHDPRRRRALAEQALVLAREIGQPRTTARVLNDYCYVFYTADGLEQRLAHLDEMAAAVQAAEDPAIEFWTVCREHETMAESGQLERVAKAAERMAAIAERVGDPTMRHNAAFAASACMALLRGDLAAAERGAAQALQIGSDAGDPDAAMFFGAQIMYVRLLQGRSTEIVDQLEQSVIANPLIPAFNGLLAYTLCWLDRRDEAAGIVAQAAEDRFEHIPRDSSRMIALGLFADAAAQAGVISAAEILYELIEPWADQVVWNGVVAEGHVRTYLGLLAAALGRDEQADEHFARAIEIQERDGMLVWTARAQLGWAEALVARGRTELAREHATHALELSREHGYGAFRPRAAAILEATISNRHLTEAPRLRGV